MSSEAQLHDAFVAYLRKLGIPYRRDRMDKRTTTTQGEPDFACYWQGKVVFVEFKHGKGKLRPAQEKRIRELRNAGCEVAVCYDLQTAISHIEAQFDLGHAGGASAAQEMADMVADGFTDYLKKASGRHLDCIGTDGGKAAVEQRDSGPCLGYPAGSFQTTQHYYLMSSRDIGQIVVRQDESGQPVFVRVANRVDLDTIPHWPEGI